MKPNGVGLAGAVINYITCSIIILASVFIFLPLIKTTQHDIWGNQTGQTEISKIFLILFIIFLTYGILGIILTIRFQLNAEKKVLIGVLTIIFGLSNILGIISGILILASSPA